MSEFKMGDRVRSTFLGDGTVTDETDIDYLVMVEYDKIPPVGYNMGENPTSQFASLLEKIL